MHRLTFVRGVCLSSVLVLSAAVVRADTAEHFRARLTNGGAIAASGSTVYENLVFDDVVVNEPGLSVAANGDVTVTQTGLYTVMVRISTTRSTGSAVSPLQLSVDGTVVDRYLSPQNGLANLFQSLDLTSTLELTAGQVLRFQVRPDTHSGVSTGEWNALDIVRHPSTTTGFSADLTNAGEIIAGNSTAETGLRYDAERFDTIGLTVGPDGSITLTQPGLYFIHGRFSPSENQAQPYNWGGVSADGNVVVRTYVPDMATQQFQTIHFETVVESTGATVIRPFAVPARVDDLAAATYSALNIVYLGQGVGGLRSDSSNASVLAGAGSTPVDVYFGEVELNSMGATVSTTSPIFVPQDGLYLLRGDISVISNTAFDYGYLDVLVNGTVEDKVLVRRDPNFQANYFSTVQRLLAGDEIRIQGIPDRFSSVSGSANNSLALVQLSTTIADMALTISDSADPAVDLTEVSYFLDVDNAGPDDAVPSITATLPPASTFVSATVPGGTCVESAGTVDCQFGLVPLGGNEVATITVTTPATPQTIQLDASVSGGFDDPMPTNDADSETTVVVLFEVGGVVWEDQNGDGIRDDVEPRLGGIVVELLDAADTLLDQTVTDGTGAYRLFAPDGGGTATPLKIRVDVPSGWVATLQDRGGDDTLDSDISRVTFTSDPFGPPFEVADAARWGAGLRRSGVCVAPDEPVFIADTRIVGTANVLDIQDPNQPEDVSGYNVYRSSDAGIPAASWPLLASNVVDADEATPNVQWVDDTGDASPSGVWYYQVTAVNAPCAAEGPR